MTFRKFFFIVLIFSLGVVLLLGLLTYYTDPCFHYRRPAQGLSYALFDEGYQNDGIAKNFDFNLIITGNSMTECFKTSEADRIFNAKSVRVSAAGSSLFEQRQYLETAFENHERIDIVIWGLDYGRMNEAPGILRDEKPAWYLYDDNPFNDIRYLLNKDMAVASFKILFKSIAGLPPDSFDTFENWLDYQDYGKKALGLPDSVPSSLNVENPVRHPDPAVPANITENVLPVVKAHPDTVFYFFLSPYFFSYFDSLRASGNLNDRLVLEWATTKAFLEYDNVRFFSFNDDGSIITVPDNYADTSHYGSWINTYILECMGSGEHEITRINFEDYCRREELFMNTFDYSKLLQQLN